MQIRQTGTAAPKLPNYQVSRDRISRPLSHTHAHSHTRVHTYHSTYQTEPQGELTILRQRVSRVWNVVREGNGMRVVEAIQLGFRDPGPKLDIDVMTAELGGGGGTCTCVALTA